ncbi:MAG TPA: NAD(+) diphosphatase [Polyangium sp.]|nr:NAD(+) diphosphatase [Polyangium sp.]
MIKLPRFRADPALHGAPALGLWFAYRGDDLLVRLVEGDTPAPPFPHDVPLLESLGELGLAPVRVQPLGWLDAVPCRSAELPPDAPVPPGFAYVSLRRLHGRIDTDVEAAAGTAYQVQYWDRTHQFCGICGAPLDLEIGRRSKRCTRCAHQHFPHVTPAIIVLVEDGPRILMTRQPRFPPGMYGLVAGFVEPGETFEACAQRETREETGIEIDDIRYFGSQPWPFPHQIMVGFFARRAGGELVVDHNELEEAAWFDRGALPKLPPPLSIARKLIDEWLAQRQ